MPPSNILLTDRSAIETDWQCGMKYWWNRLEGERGIVPVTEDAPLRVGRDIHADFLLIGQGRRSEEVIAMIPPPSSPSQEAWEEWARRVGWVIALDAFYEQHEREQYENVMIEDELILDRTPLWIAVTPDRLRRQRSTGRLVYREYKTAASFSYGWVKGWVYAPQLHIGLAAIEEELNEKVGYGQIMGVLKGSNRDGRLVHPYVWAYWKNGEWSPSYKYGWDHAPVWDYPASVGLSLEEGMKKWVVEVCGEESARSIFTFSPPVYLDHRIVHSVVASQTVRQQQIRAEREGCREDRVRRAIIFPQRFSQCQPAYGSACPYVSACHHASINVAPLTFTDSYLPRIPHHEVEIVGVGGDE